MSLSLVDLSFSRVRLASHHCPEGLHPASRSKLAHHPRLLKYTFASSDPIVLIDIAWAESIAEALGDPPCVPFTMAASLSGLHG